ncbi:MAG TPA: VOC family protein [Pirellulales bacterium]|jgi:catechol 2,3-dioxygenase-like lactoylglutathione lyase family enzyme
MQRSIGYVTIVVRDYDEAIKYYVDTLGFSLIENTPMSAGESGEPIKRWVVLRPSKVIDSQRIFGASLLLAKAKNANEMSRVGNQTGGRVFLFLHTDDFWRDYRMFKSKGVKFVEEPRQEAYGSVVVFEDLYGNRWDLVERSRGNVSSSGSH